MDKCPQIIIFISPSKPLEKDLAVTSPLRGKNPLERII